MWRLILSQNLGAPGKNVATNKLCLLWLWVNPSPPRLPYFALDSSLSRAHPSFPILLHSSLTSHLPSSFFFPAEVIMVTPGDEFIEENCVSFKCLPMDFSVTKTSEPQECSGFKLPPTSGMILSSNHLPSVLRK